jgi:DNA topoisomerase-1
MKIFRIRTDDGFEYVDRLGKPANQDALDYISSLQAIPPAYEDVVIFVEKSPKILFEGIDTKGRKQQIYSAKWRQASDKAKFKNLIEFGKALPKITRDINKYIGQSRKTKNKLISLIIKIIIHCGFRIGHLKYFKLYNSTGLSTLQKKHVKFNDGEMYIEFMGKKAMLNKCSVSDEEVIKELRKLVDGAATDEDFLFVYDDGKLITSDDVNNWLKEYNPKFTSKYFRTFVVNDMIIEGLQDEDPVEMTAAARKRKIRELVEVVADAINNTPAICKKSYINKELLDLYIANPKKFKKMMINDSSGRVNFIKFLEKTH